jgi:hypothetical protein
MKNEITKERDNSTTKSFLNPKGISLKIEMMKDRKKKLNFLLANRKKNFSKLKF